MRKRTERVVAVFKRRHRLETSGNSRASVYYSLRIEGNEDGTVEQTQRRETREGYTEESVPSLDATTTYRLIHGYVKAQLQSDLRRRHYTNVNDDSVHSAGYQLRPQLFSPY